MRDFHFPGRSTVYASNGMCATSYPTAAKVAVNLLEDGGNALDAAIGAAMVLGLAEPQMTGLGGDCFALIKPAGSESIHTVNGSGRAPAAQTGDALRGAGHETVPLYDAAAVTVPGAVDAMCRMSDRWGTLELAKVLAPAIKYADEGIPVAPRVAFDWALESHLLQGDARRHFLLDGAAPLEGQLFRAPGQAEVFRKIANHGRDGFYAGEVAADLVASLRALGGLHTEDDFAATEATFGEPIAGSYRGLELIEHPPNGQGATAILLAAILEEFDLASLDPFGADRAHLELEAAKLAYDASRRFIGDPDHGGSADRLLSKDTAKALAALIDPHRTQPDPAGVTEAIHKDTVYVSVVDKDMMAVSLIYSIFHGFGSGLASTKYGVLFHNRGAGFNLVPGHANEVGGGKRPLHTILPAMVRENDRLDTVFGVMGGGYQPTGHARMLTNWRDFGLGLQDALDAPRCFADPKGTQVERSYAPKVAQELANRGHTILTPDMPIGGAQAIKINYDTGVLEGASDPRKDGCALGY